MKTDIEIAHETKLLPIQEVAKKAGIAEEVLDITTVGLRCRSGGIQRQSLAFSKLTFDVVLTATPHANLAITPESSTCSLRQVHGTFINEELIPALDEVGQGFEKGTADS